MTIRLVPPASFESDPSPAPVLPTSSRARPPRGTWSHTRCPGTLILAKVMLLSRGKRRADEELSRTLLQGVVGG